MEGGAGAGLGWGYCMSGPHIFAPYSRQDEGCCPALRVQFCCGFLILVPADLSFPISRGRSADEVSGFSSPFSKGMLSHTPHWET